VTGLEEARLNVPHAFERIGMQQLFVEPEAGMFLWARFPNVDDVSMSCVVHPEQGLFPNSFRSPLILQMTS
jgi:hypothetical protein